MSQDMPGVGRMTQLLTGEQLKAHLERPILGLSDIRSFDMEAAKLVTEMQIGGWRGVVTSKGHVRMLAPDGTSTAVVSRSSDRGRSGPNMWAPWKRWQAEHPLPLLEEAERIAAGAPLTTTFGQMKTESQMTRRIFDEELGAWVPVELQAAVLRNPDLIRRMKATPEQMRRSIGWDPTNPSLWVVGAFSDVTGVVVLGCSSAFADEAAALEWFLQDNEEARVAHATYLERKGSGVVESEEVMKSYVCPECSEQFDAANKLNVHRAQRHGGGACPECGKELPSAGRLGAHRAAAHGVHGSRYKPKPPKPVVGEVAAVCPGCGFRARNKHGLATHSRACTGVPLAASVVSVPVVVEQPGSDVLAQHLVTSPQGGDAEGIVAQVRALVAAPLVVEYQRVRGERDEAVAQVELLTKQVAELTARLDLLREALSA